MTRTTDQVETTATCYGYKPYKGGGGPNLQHRNKNTQALSDTLTYYNIKHSVTSNRDNVKSIVSGSRRVAYDRWGFNGRQMGLFEAVDYIANA